jgi:2,4-dienoyl-CoA reductase-like NADH-dependent reductase (Old Yellow Enzyme family)
MSSSLSTFFQLLRVGVTNLQHCVVMAPLTRFRANKDHVHGELAKTYYSQCSSVPGTLLITEDTFIVPQAGGYANAPGIWSNAQITAWKVVSRIRVYSSWWYAYFEKITDAVHANGSFIFLQLWALGCVANPVVLDQEGGFDVVGASPIPVPGSQEQVIPRTLTLSEIKEYVRLYTKAARNAKWRLDLMA